MNKKLLVSVFLCFFVFSLSVVSQEFRMPTQKKEWKAEIQAEKEKSGFIIYVDDATGDDKNGDGSEKKPYRTINKALSIADSWDTIKVGPGIYNENLRVRIDKIIIEGSGMDTTVISGSSETTTISAWYTDLLVFRDLTISGGWTGLGCYWVRQTRIARCSVKDCRTGVRIVGQSHANLWNCHFINNMTGLWADHSSYASLDDCLISGSGLGIWAFRNSCIELRGCEIKDHNWGGWIYNNSTLIMYESTVHNNEVGLWLFFGGIGEIGGSDLEKNVFRDNNDGIWVGLGASVGLRNTDILDNNERGIRAWGGSSLNIDPDVIISGNDFGLTITEFANAQLWGVSITGNHSLDVLIENGGRAYCTPNLIGILESDCPYCKGVEF